MPKKTAKNKEKPEEPNVETTPVEVVPAETSQSVNRSELALARVNAVLAGGGVPQGRIADQRAGHQTRWETLLKEDQTTRTQILELKQKENEVLGMIRDRVADNLIDTLDTAVEQGVLSVPEEV